MHYHGCPEASERKHDLVHSSGRRAKIILYLRVRQVPRLDVVVGQANEGGEEDDGGEHDKCRSVGTDWTHDVDAISLPENKCR